MLIEHSEFIFIYVFIKTHTHLENLSCKGAGNLVLIFFQKQGKNCDVQKHVPRD